jgi:hypothetical protein
VGCVNLFCICFYWLKTLWGQWFLHYYDDPHLCPSLLHGEQTKLGNLTGHKLPYSRSSSDQRLSSEISVERTLQELSTNTKIIHLPCNRSHVTKIYERFEVFTAVKMTILFSWVIMPCRLTGRYNRFGKKTYCLHIQPWGSMFLRKVGAIALMMEAVSTSETSSVSTRLHGAISQKTAIFVLVAVRTWNLNLGAISVSFFKRTAEVMFWVHSERFLSFG